MIQKNVYYQSPPDKVVISEKGNNAVVEIPVNVVKVEKEDGDVWLAETVYYAITKNAKNLRDRVLRDFDAWLEIASAPEPEPQATVQDLVDYVDALTEMILGGE